MKTSTPFKFSIKVAAFCALLLSASCSNDDDIVILKPEVELSFSEQNLKMNLNDTLTITAENTNDAIYEEEWKRGDSAVSTANTYDFIPTKAGDYQLSYRAFNSAGEFKKEYSIQVIELNPDIEMSIAEQELQLKVGEIIEISTINKNEATYVSEWKLGDSIVSSEATYIFEALDPGDYQLSYRAFNSAGEFIKTYAIAVTSSIRPVTDQSSAYVTDLLEYLPAPGQFINTNVGNETGAAGILGKKNGLVSLGSWGGSIILGFDHTVIDQENANDLVIYANALFTLAEPGVAWVMRDENANGLADDTWYEIKGSANAMEGVIKNYSVTYFRPETATDDVPWEDSEGNTGLVLTNAFHKQAYYPESITDDAYTITGTLLPDTNIDQSNPSYITSAPFEYGYADNTVGGDEIDLSDAIDVNGNPIALEGIDFIKIQTGVQANMGWLGELSTEVSGIADLSILN